MFARLVTFPLKPDTATQFKKILETAVVPLLNRQEGFQYELALITPDGREGIGISMWDTEQHEQKYAKESYSEALEMLKSVTASTPTVKTYEAPIATFSTMAAKSGAF